MGSQTKILFHEIFNVQTIFVVWTTFFFLALKSGRNSLAGDVCPTPKITIQGPTKKFDTLIKELVFRADIFCLLKTTFNSSNRKNILVVWSEQKMKGNQLSILITYCIIIQTYKIFCPACSWNYPVPGGKTKCRQTNKLPTERLAFCPFFFVVGVLSVPIFGWHYVRTVSTCFDILSESWNSI